MLRSLLLLAMAALGAGSLPPWWVLNGVQPYGPVVDMGGWTAVSFSKTQQATFGVASDGAITDIAVHEAALAKVKTPSKSKSEWPELVGAPDDEAVDAIQKSRPDLTVVKMPTDAMMTMDYRLDRVRVLVENGVVDSVPRLG